MNNMKFKWMSWINLIINNIIKYNIKIKMKKLKMIF